MQQIWSNQYLYTSPAFFNNKQGFKKDTPGPNEKNVDCRSHMAVTSMVPNPSENVNRETTSFATPPTSSIKPPDSDTSIRALLKGVFNQRPPQPRYVFILDIQTVLDFVKCQWSGCDLSDKVFSYKVVILMVLSSAFRALATHHLDVRYMLRPERKFVYSFFHRLNKSWKYGKAPPNLEYCEQTEDRDLLVVTTLNEYIKRTYQRRAENRRSQLLLSFIQPYVECLIQLSLDRLRRL